MTTEMAFIDAKKYRDRNKLLDACKAALDTLNDPVFFGCMAKAAAPRAVEIRAQLRRAIDDAEGVIR